LPKRPYRKPVFNQKLKEMEQDIRKTAYRRQALQWMQPEEIYNWMVYELWRACDTFDPSKGDANLTVEKYWWKCWMNRRSKLNRDWRRGSVTINDHAVHYEAYSESGLYENQGVLLEMEVIARRSAAVPTPPCPIPGSLESRVWKMLAHGFTQVEVCELLDLRLSVLKQIIQQFKSPTVKNYLTEQLAEQSAKGM
jgi:hypothetical protein